MSAKAGAHSGRTGDGAVTARNGLRISLVCTFVDFYRAIADVSAEANEQIGEIQKYLCLQGTLVSTARISSLDEAEQHNRTLRDLQPDVVVIVPLVAVFGTISAACVDGLACPVLVWHEQPDPRVTESYGLRTLIRNSGGLGAAALSNLLARKRHAFRMVCGVGRGDPIGRDRISRWLSAVRAASKVRGARFGVVGTPFMEMGDIVLDTEEFARQFDADFDMVPAEELSASCSARSDCAVQDAHDELTRQFSVRDIEPGETNQSLRLYLSLKELAQQRQWDAATINCHGQNCLRNPSIGVTACYGVSMLTTNGCPMTCTGDLPTAVAMLLLKHLSGEAQYVELDMVDGEDNCVLLANGGEADLTLATSTPAVVGNQNFTGLNGRGASFDIAPHEGAATLLSYTPIDGHGAGRLIVGTGDVQSVHLPQLRLYHQTFRFSRHRAAEAFELWCEAGAVHHSALCRGDWSGELCWIAQLLGMEFVTI
jgi:L-arabinose isomerase